MYLSESEIVSLSIDFDRYSATENNVCFVALMRETETIYSF